MITATFCILLKVNSLSVFFDRMISSLNFTPNKMDVYYNEFLPQKFLVKYNPQLPHLLSKAEVDGGITSFSLYDSKYSNERVTPFFRAKILDTTFSNEQVVCVLEWVSYPTLYFNPDTHFLNNCLCDDVKLIFLFAYNQLDIRTAVQTNYLKKLLNPRLRWGKMVMIKDYENPNLHRNSQKKYWKVTSLSQRIKKYKEQTFSIDAISQYKKRYEKMKANHALE